MKVGDLICTSRAMIGVPKGSMALIIKVEETSPDLIDEDCPPNGQFSIHTVKFIGRTSGRATRRMLAHDLEVVSG